MYGVLVMPGVRVPPAPPPCDHPPAFAVGKRGNVALLATGGRKFCGGNNDSVFVGWPPIATLTLVIGHSGEAAVMLKRR